MTFLFFYLALGQWAEACDICEKYDRVHLKSAYYMFGQYLEESGRFMSAVKLYEVAEAPIRIAEMLFESQNLHYLEKYVQVLLLYSSSLACLLSCPCLIRVF